MSKEKLTKRTKDVAMLRGAIINDVILLEKIIDNWLAIYFCSNKVKSTEFFELILCHDRFTYESKKTVFCFIVEKRCPGFLVKHPKLSADLSDIGTKRNILAHWLLDSSDTGIESEEIMFVRIKNVTKPEPFKVSTIVKLSDDIVKYKHEIYNLVHPPIDYLLS